MPSRNGAAVLLGHGSGGSRERVVAHVRMLARHGYGVLALDLPGNGESDGHSNGLGDNAQPAVDAALDYLSRRPDVDPGRIAAFGSSIGGEVLLETAAHDPRLRAVVADGAARPVDAQAANDSPLVEEGVQSLALGMVRGISRHAAGALAERPDAADRAAAGPADRQRRRPDGAPDDPRLPGPRRRDDRVVGAAGDGRTPAACASTPPSTSAAPPGSSTRRCKSAPSPQR